eukprot:TRINITY_DN7616_c0_g1_i1.p1 TRINITY_DN7616_c0_g1~~TRINITY_DN7616_c0_g1_i1.p1  ORF type:complete len:340 (+),score=118.78 TRINITY_DN7616_c0_g1_i1:86-1021(+)
MTRGKTTLCVAGLFLLLAVLTAEAQAGSFFRSTSFTKTTAHQERSLSFNERVVRVSSHSQSDVQSTATPTASSHSFSLRTTLTRLRTQVLADDDPGTPVEQQVVTGLVLVVLMFFGIAICFAGYRLIKFLVLVIGFMIGMALCYLALESLGEALDEPNDGWYFWTSVGVSALAGVLGAIVAWKFFIVAVFIIGGAVGVFVAEGLNLLIIDNFGSNDWSTPVFIVLLILLFIVFGLIAVKIQRVMLILGTAVIGALYISMTLLWLLEVLSVDPETANIISGVFLIILAVAGTVVQYRVTARSYNHEHDHHHH